MTLSQSTYLEKMFEKKFWDQAIADTDWTPEYCEEFLADDISRHCSIEYLATATSYLQDVKSSKTKRVIPNISSCDQKIEVLPGTLLSHMVSYQIKGEQRLLELPEVQVQIDDKPYVTLLRGVRQNTSGIGKFEDDFLRAFGRSLAYCIRLAIPTGKIITVAMEEMHWKWDVIQRFKENAEKYAFLIRTEDYWLADWVERAAAICNTQQQVDVLAWIYCRAATFNTRQPRICKKTLSDQTGISRGSIRNLFDKLEKNGLMVQQPEGYRTVNGVVKSEARIVNLDPKQVNRWIFYEKLPTIDRSKEKKERKAAKLEKLGVKTK